MVYSLHYFTKQNDICVALHLPGFEIRCMLFRLIFSGLMFCRDWKWFDIDAFADIDLGLDIIIRPAAWYACHRYIIKLKARKPRHIQNTNYKAHQPQHLLRSSPAGLHTWHSRRQCRPIIRYAMELRRFGANIRREALQLPRSCKLHWLWGENTLERYLFLLMSSRLLLLSIMGLWLDDFYGRRDDTRLVSHSRCWFTPPTRHGRPMNRYRVWFGQLPFISFYFIYATRRRSYAARYLLLLIYECPIDII